MLHKYIQKTNNNPKQSGSETKPLWGRLQPNRRLERDLFRKGGKTAWVRDGFFNKKSRHERYKVRDDVAEMTGPDKQALSAFLQLYVRFATQNMDYAGSSPVGIS